MPEIIAGVFFCFFAIVGIVEVARCVKKYLLEPCGKSPAFVVTCAGHDERIEYYVRSLANQANELYHGGKRMIVVVDAGMDDETRSICERLEQDIAGVTICKSGELPHLIETELQN